MNVAHLKKLIADLPDGTEVLVEIRVPGGHTIGESMWLVHADTRDGALARGETVANEYTHRGGPTGDVLHPAAVILEVTFNHFDVKLTPKTLPVEPSRCRECGCRDGMHYGHCSKGAG